MQSTIPLLFVHVKYKIARGVRLWTKRPILSGMAGAAPFA